MKDTISTPICDFLLDYADSGISRFHMPGHKGAAPEDAVLQYSHDITEIPGADSLYEAAGIIRASEENASSLFGTALTLYSTEGSSQCIRAMLALAAGFFSRASNSVAAALRAGSPGVQEDPCFIGEGRPVILAARNVHRSFLTAAALLDLDVKWLYPETDSWSLCACPVSAASVRDAILSLPVPPAAVYLTSPDYLGNLQKIREIAAAAHEFGVPLLVDNAHGAYLHFLENPVHPMDLGADLCCDSAHKTLPALTGCAYLHISASAPSAFLSHARRAMALFGSTSPSYLLLESLDRTNALLSGPWRASLAACEARVHGVKQRLQCHGFVLAEDCFPLTPEPLKITLCASRSGYDGRALAQILRFRGIECEYADPDDLVLMVSPGNSAGELDHLTAVLESLPVPALQSSGASSSPQEKLHSPEPVRRPRCPHPEPILSIRSALLAPSVEIPAEESAGCICADPALVCPPAGPIIICGERIPREAISIVRHYGISRIRVLESE